MHPLLQQDLTELDTLLKQTKELSINFLNRLDAVPASSDYSIAESNTSNMEGLGAMQTLQLFQQQYQPLMVSSGGPRYWGFVTGGTTPASIMGDWLASVYDQNTQALKGQGDISAQIEKETLQLLLQLFNLPHAYTGGFVTGATMSNFTCLATARQWMGKQQGNDIAKDGITQPIKVFSATPHSSAIKSMAMLGMGSRQFVKIKTMPGNREAMDMDDLQKQLADLNGEPCILISSAGTVNTVDYDDFTAIAALRKKYSFWWHIDAAFGGFVACSPLYAHLVKDWEDADSITIDCHKWLNVPYDSAVFFIKEKHRLLQLETFQNSNAPYLGNPMENFSYLNFLPENSRRLRALPAWFTLKAYGKEGYRAVVENSVAMAQRLGNFIEQHPALALLAPVRLNTVCFALAHAADGETETFLHHLNSSGKIFMTLTVYNSRKGIRAAFVNWRTTAADVDAAIDLINLVLNK